MRFNNRNDFNLRRKRAGTETGTRDDLNGELQPTAWKSRKQHGGPGEAMMIST